MLNVTLSAAAGLSIAVGGLDWLRGGVTTIRHHGQWYADNCTEMFVGSCKSIGTPVESNDLTGSDSIGEFKEAMVKYHAPGGVRFTTGVRTYQNLGEDIAVLTQHFPDGLVPQNQHGRLNEVVSAFPTFGDALLDLGVLMYEGCQLQNTHFFRWKQGSAFDALDTRVPPSNSAADDDGAAMPLVLTSSNGTTLIISPLDDYFTACQTVSEATGKFSIGIQGTTVTVPPGHLHRTLVVSGSSVSKAMLRWGDIFLASAGGGKKRSMQWTIAGDPGLRMLSYYTDNGAYYYYHTEKNQSLSKSMPPLPYDSTGYHQLMHDLSTYFNKSNIPFGAVQFDSWWYYKGKTAGVQLWEPMPSTLGGQDVNGDPGTWLKFPGGLSTVTHSRYYEADNAYITGAAPGMQGKNFSWIISDQIAASNDSGFFEHIFSRAKAGLHMATYEQDFLIHTYEACTPLQQHIGLAESWLTAMSEGAERTNVTIQYCMALPRHILQSAAYPRVTHARASHDYGQSRNDDTEQWSSLGMTAQLYWALGILPFKDDFWSETTEAGNKWKSQEADPELQTLVSALMAGPIGPSDRIGGMNISRVMQTCRRDGVLLKPLAPAVNLDSTYAHALKNFRVDDAVSIVDVWIATSAPDGVIDAAAAHQLLFFANITAATCPTGYSVAITELGGAGLYLAQEYYTRQVRWVAPGAPLTASPQTKPASCRNGGFHVDYCTPYEFWSLAPLVSPDAAFILMGEVDKYIPVSTQRFSTVVGNSTALAAVVTVTAHEVVVVQVAHLTTSVVADDTVPPLPIILRTTCTGGAGLSQMALRCQHAQCECTQRR
eukprot:m.800507 g.800507  ORF g.800507 m.800507 type:complete len:823 (-) comp23355_c0_seq15:151-2619(-)